ncbi:MAG: hypothetical protein U1F55_05610 [Chitinivorax sp.]
MSAQKLDSISGLVAISSLVAMIGGTLVATWVGKTTPALSITAGIQRARWRVSPARTGHRLVR